MAPFRGQTIKQGMLWGVVTLWVTGHHRDVFSLHIKRKDGDGHNVRLKVWKTVVLVSQRLHLTQVILICQLKPVLSFMRLCCFFVFMRWTFLGCRYECLSLTDEWIVLERAEPWQNNEVGDNTMSIIQRLWEQIQVSLIKNRLTSQGQASSSDSHSGPGMSPKLHSGSPFLPLKPTECRIDCWRF